MSVITRNWLLGEGDPGVAVRRMLLVLVLAGAAGLLAELLLLEHYESVWQWVPLVLLGCALLGGIALAARPSQMTVRLFQGVSGLMLLAAGLGLYFHFRGNVEFEREMDAAAVGVALVWRSLRGATPALAPGALAQLGLLGLIATYRHPALRPKTQDACSTLPAPQTATRGQPDPPVPHQEAP
ncbi:MAG: hypothetical protein ACR2F9_03415 [Longimicrobiaceae bacterium]